MSQLKEEESKASSSPTPTTTSPPENQQQRPSTSTTFSFCNLDIADLLEQMDALNIADSQDQKQFVADACSRAPPHSVLSDSVDSISSVSSTSSSPRTPATSAGVVFGHERDPDPSSIKKLEEEKQEQQEEKQEQQEENVEKDNIGGFARCMINRGPGGAEFQEGSPIFLPLEWILNRLAKGAMLALVMEFLWTTIVIGGNPFKLEDEENQIHDSTKAK